MKVVILAGSCGLELPDWTIDALNERDTLSRRYHLARLKETNTNRNGYCL